MTAARNASMQRFKQLSIELQLEIRRDAIAELVEQSDILMQQMKAAAPLGPTGNLRASIRREVGKKGNRIVIKAGGKLTTVQHRAASVRATGKATAPYDYSMAVEFGTQQAGAHPFFWPSWRLRRKSIRSRMVRKITANIKKRSAE